MRAAILTAAFLLIFSSLAPAEEAQTARALMEAGIGYLKAGEPDKAADRFRDAIRLTPNNPDSHLQLGFSLQKLGKYREALGAYQDALALDARHPYAAEAHYNMGVSCDELGEGKNALGHMKPTAPTTAGFTGSAATSSSCPKNIPKDPHRPTNYPLHGEKIPMTSKLEFHLCAGNSRDPRITRSTARKSP